MEAQIRVPAKKSRVSLQIVEAGKELLGDMGRSEGAREHIEAIWT